MEKRKRFLTLPLFFSKSTGSPIMINPHKSIVKWPLEIVNDLIAGDKIKHIRLINDHKIGVGQNSEEEHHGRV